MDHLVFPALLFGAAIALGTTSAIAQVVPDDTLPIHSAVTSDSHGWQINGGTVQGNNLFHSFQEFSIPDGHSVHFDNDLSIERIVTRVTGNSVSELNGTLAANGMADLFLLNPNGVVFGPNARLDIGGAFLASTGEALHFADGTVFRALQTEAPLLTLSVPVGVQMGPAAGAIQLGTPVAPLGPHLTPGVGRSLTLVGNGITATNSQLSAIDGSIALHSIQSGKVDLVGQLGAVADPATAVANDIVLQQGTQIETMSWHGSGSIRLQGQQVHLKGGSQLSNLNWGDFPSGEIRITASDLLQISDRAPNSSQASLIQSATFGNGEGADIHIQTGRLQILPGGNILAGTAGPGTGGDILITATDAVLGEGQGFENLQALFETSFLEDFQANGSTSLLNGEINSSTPLDSAIFTATFASGAAGALTIDTPQLALRNGALLASTTFSSGQGGDLSIRNAADVWVTDSSITAGVLVPGSSGDAGDLDIATDRLILRDRSLLLSVTYGAGDGGNLTISAAELIDLGQTHDGPGILPPPTINSNSVFGTGRGGDIQITAGRAQFTSAAIATQSGALLNEGLFDFTSVLSTADPVVQVGGPAGNIEITIADTLVLSAAAAPVLSEIDVSSFTAQPPGTITVQAPTVLITDGGRISANSFFQSEVGGQITLNSELLMLAREGIISSNILGPQGSQAGTIDIRTTTLLAVDNSDIVAGAFLQGQGGRITIDADLILGAQFRNRLSLDSDITAPSAPGFQAGGTVVINALNPNLTTDSPDAPELINSTDVISTGCTAVANSRFTVSGRGGLPESPHHSLEGGKVWQDLRLPILTAQLEPVAADTPEPPADASDVRLPFLEATRLLQDAQGTMRLVAEATPPPQNVRVCGESL